MPDGLFDVGDFNVNVDAVEERVENISRIYKATTNEYEVVGTLGESILETPHDINTPMDERLIAQRLVSNSDCSVNRLAAADAYAGNISDLSGNGFHGIIELVCSHVSDDIRRRVEESDIGPIKAFNRARSGFSISQSAYIARYELLHDNTYDDDEYEDQLTTFAESGNLEDWEPMQTELSCYYEENPYDDASLTREEARTVMELRLHDYTDTAVDLDEIENHSVFRERLKQGHTPEIARLSEQLGGVDPDILDKLPDEWVDEPDDIIVETSPCAGCYEDVFVARHESGDVGVITRHEDGGEVLSDDSPYFYMNDDEADAICASCAESVHSSKTARIALPDRPDCYLEYAAPIGYDKGVESDNHTALPELEDDVHQRAVDALLDGSSEAGFVYLSYTDGPASNLDTSNALNYVTQNGIDTDSLLLFEESVSYGETHYRVFFPQEDIDAAREAKEILESPQYYV